MYHFWDTIIEPILEILKPETIVELGSEYGTNTRNLLFLRNYTKVHVVDPLPKYDVAAWQEKYGERFVFHKALSLEALPLIDRFDVVLIDGDHNWYTVYNELKLIEKRCVEIPQPFPLVMLHDVGWPYGRRDLYYSPETIPKAYRNPYEKKGMRPGLTELVEESGINPVLHNAVYENGPQNGVLTAIEDFLSETEQQLDLIKVPGLHGLGIVVPLWLKEQSEELVKFLANLDLSSVVARYIERIEETRLETMIELDERDATIRNLREQLAAIQSKLKRIQQGSKFKRIQQRSEALRFALAVLPAEATVIVVGEGDDDLPELGGRKRWHFPRAEDGGYAGYPADSSAAIAQLEALRVEGGDYLLFPGSALWWLEHYEKFRQHLESRYQVVLRQEDTCVVFALRQPVVSENAGWRTEFEEMIMECQLRLRRDPAILDWNTGLELADIFPQHTIFSPPTADGVLPYLDQSIDIVVVSSPDLASITEAHRVAKAAVVTFTGAELANTTQIGAESSFTLVTDWQLEEAAVALPTASIVIPTYNGITHLETCLGALRETLPPSFSGEIIIVDDASTDETPDVLERWTNSDERLKVLHNPKNAGFVASCNRGASAATGEIIIFLNNDTLALPGWLTSLLQTFRDHPDAGVVGGKLVYPDGRLQEAGGVIFADGSGANFGRGDHEVDAPLYNYLREVDYCSGALLATRRSLFQEVGGFDTRYCPAYYEDTDYCFAVREKGFRVYYQPESTIVHLEGATSGTDLSSGVKQYQVVNQAKFVEKWAHVLKRQRLRPDRYTHQTWYALAVRDEMEGAESG